MRDGRCGVRRRSSKHWGSIDFVVHAIAFSDKEELKGRYADTTRENFVRTMVISCFSFTEVAAARGGADAERRRHADAHLSAVDRVMPNYNVMGVAKAALEASVRYLAADFGQRNIRVNAISAGPMRTLAGAGVADARYMFAFQQNNSPLRRGVTLEEIGGAGFICCPTCRAASPARSTSSIPATTSSPCRSPTRSRPRTARSRARTAGSKPPHPEEGAERARLEG